MSFFVFVACDFYAARGTALLGFEKETIRETVTTSETLQHLLQQRVFKA